MVGRRILFFGTSNFSLPSLDVLSEPDVVTKEVENPILKAARQKGLRLFFDFEDIKDEYDFLVVASYGRIIPVDVLRKAHHTLNVHPSLLPKFRGPAPIPWVILSGDECTGVTICTVTEKPDAGDIILQRKEKIKEEDDAKILEERLAKIGANMLQETIKLIEEGKEKYTPQDESKATWARALRKEDGEVDWTHPAEYISRCIKAFYGWPTTWTYMRKERVIIHKGYPMDGKGEPGVILDITKEAIITGCGEGALAITEIQREGRRKLKALDFANGMRLKRGDKFG